MENETSAEGVPNAGTLYKDSLAAYGDRVALIDGVSDEKVTYQELDSKIIAAGNALSELGVTQGDRVALCFPNELLYVYAFFGAIQIGAVPVPINIELSEDKLAYLLDDSDTTLIVTSDSLEVRTQSLQLADEVTSVHTCAVAVDAPRTDAEVDADIRSFTELLDEVSSSLEPVSVDADDPALQPYTSGTTGRPKGVVITHEGMEWNSDAVQRVHFFDQNDRGLVAAPLYHKNAMIGAIKPLFRAGGSTVVIDQFDPGRVITAIDNYGITYLRGVPAMYKMLVNAEEELNTHDVSSIEWAVSGSASLPESLVNDFESLFDAPLGEGYGLTEGGVVTLSPRWGPRKIGSSGLDLPGSETRIADPETGEPISTRETGELLVSNPQVARYYNRPDANAEAFSEHDGRRFLHTGDLAWKDEQGYHYIVGRLDDMLTVGGHNVYPTEVEDLLLERDDVDDTAVVAVPHEMKGEAPVAFVVASDVTENELREYALEHGPAYAHPRRIFFKDELPLAGTGKTDKDTLQAEAADRIDREL